MPLSKPSDPEERQDQDPLHNLRNAARIVALILVVYLSSLWVKNANKSLNLSTGEQAQALASKLVYKDSNTVTIDLADYPSALLPGQQDAFRKLVRSHYAEHCQGCPAIKSIRINGKSMEITFGPQTDTQPRKVLPSAK